MSGIIFFGLGAVFGGYVMCRLVDICLKATGVYVTVTTKCGHSFTISGR